MYMYFLITLWLLLVGINVIGEIFGVEIKVDIIFKERDLLKLIQEYCGDAFDWMDDISLTPILLKIGYKLLYVYSVLEIKLESIYNKFKPIINPFIEEVINFLKKFNIILDDTDKCSLLCIIDHCGSIIKMYSIGLSDTMDESILKGVSDSYMKHNEPYIYIYNDLKNANSQCINSVIYNAILDNHSDMFKYKMSNVRFMMIELEYKDNKFLIELKNDKNNYYIVNNRFDELFFKYYLHDVYNIKFEKDSIDYIDYKINIIDGNVNMFVLLPNQYILLNENDYSICSYNTDIKTDTNLTNTYENMTDNDLMATNLSSSSEKLSDFVKLE